MNPTLEDIAEVAAEFVLQSKLNAVPEIGLQRIFDAPLVGVSRATDPLYDTLKDDSVVRKGHLYPQEWLPGAKSVISFFLPFSQEVRSANSEQGLPHLKWVYGRIEGELLNDALRRFLVGWMEEAGGQALVPAHDGRYGIEKMCANWSERHVAYISGLGTFGLSKSIITRKGSAGRCGSVVTDLGIEPSVRPYSDLYEWCSSCGQCIDRCPAQAISLEGGKKHSPCAKYLKEVTSVQFAPRYGCGKCQTAVMCEGCAPVL